MDIGALLNPLPEETKPPFFQAVYPSPEQDIMSTFSASPTLSPKDTPPASPPRTHSILPSASTTSTTRKKIHACQICNKVCSNSTSLKSHIRTHTGERPFACPYPGCTAAYTTNQRLTIHKRSHSLEFPYICERNCGFAAKQKCELVRHRLVHMSHQERLQHHAENQRTLPCAGCGKLFKNSLSLDKHCWNVHGHAPAAFPFPYL
ncbi:hypothetical protein BCR33DRAFT_715907 [Rhizoclosmatium globosum]|uniref:C2H2-type domain-containing protein n=1 Tax=Rhizoclosmatium globosum TaxID=329046 RepID=A0A1Y2CFM8_9FUNG|nr:hypothetical protein BCR33DRAFT_715907 [Rhizoclosmatium globosum]|eukprot:ORY45873.1 hypothetical protein BCR33DRAFT_715907 [Rhizoclosmatium globosum]